MATNTKTTWPTPSAVPAFAAPSAAAIRAVTAKAPSAMAMSASVGMQIG